MICNLPSCPPNKRNSKHVAEKKKKTTIFIIKQGTASWGAGLIPQQGIRKSSLRRTRRTRVNSIQNFRIQATAGDFTIQRQSIAAPASPATTHRRLPVSHSILPPVSISLWYVCF